MRDLGPLGFLRARDERRRSVTAILYLNESDWDSGGELACFIGAEPSDDEGSTALHLACANGKVKAAKLLLAAGADVATKNEVRWRGPQRATAAAAAHGRFLLCIY